MLEERKLIADIDISELINNDNVINYSQNDSEEAYHEALKIFERFCSVTAQYSIIEVLDTGLDTYLLLLVYQDFDIDEKILGPNENTFMLTSYAQIINHLPLNVYDIDLGDEAGNPIPGKKSLISSIQANGKHLDFFDDQHQRCAHILSTNLEGILCYVLENDAKKLGIEKRNFRIL